MKIEPLVPLSAAIACALFITPTPASADVIGSFIVNGDGSVTYFYEVNNSAGLFDVAAWSIDFDLTTPDWNPLDVLSGGDVDVPDANWLADTGNPITGASAQDFLSLMPGSDISVGTILGGFSFTSSFPPGLVTYHEYSALGDFLAGTTIGPVSVVPEAGGWLAGIALGTLLALVTHWRRSTSSV